MNDDEHAILKEIKAMHEQCLDEIQGFRIKSREFLVGESIAEITNFLREKYPDLQQSLSKDIYDIKKYALKRKKSVENAENILKKMAVLDRSYDDIKEMLNEMSKIKKDFLKLQKCLYVTFSECKKDNKKPLSRITPLRKLRKTKDTNEY